MQFSFQSHRLKDKITRSHNLETLVWCERRELYLFVGVTLEGKNFKGWSKWIYCPAGKSFNTWAINFLWNGGLKFDIPKQYASTVRYPAEHICERSDIWCLSAWYKVLSFEHLSSPPCHWCLQIFCSESRALALWRPLRHITMLVKSP